MTDNIAEWIANNTFHHSQFWDMQALVRQKEKTGLKISLCIPTLNEAATIGKEVVIFRSELMERYPLVDEIAVIDSGSSDNTCEIAQSFGADVYYAGDILPEMGHKGGKGENLWKAIYQLKGDIICYVDADIKNIHPRFCYGLVAPLLYREEVQYVKAFYDRPLAISKDLRPSGGGRVTEILVRPLFSLFYPELTALIQPLSGEYAVRRQVLEQLHFPIGYGVETSHILDVYKDWGLSAFAQTDLDQRVHRNQATVSLGKMSFGILQAFLSRMEDQGIARLPDMSRVLRQFQAQDKTYAQELYTIVEEERPPMLSLQAYASMRASLINA